MDWGAVAIAGTSDPTLYRTERYGANLQYSLTVPNGTYQVNLYFAENYVNSGFPNGGIGFRLLTVQANGVTIVSNLDLFAQAGAHQAVIRTATVNVTNGQLVLSAPTTGWFVNAIEVIGQSAVADTTPPTVPSGVAATPQSSSSIQLSWNASTDSGSGVGGYRILRDGTAVTTVGGTSYLDTGRTANTSYVYTITAFDLANPVNESAPTAAVQATTFANTDTVPPTVPTGLLATPLSSGSIALQWNAASDAGTGVGGYHVFRNGVQIGTTTLTTSFTDSGLSASTQYGYSISAFDKEIPANESTPSATVLATTLTISNSAALRINAGGGVYTDGAGNTWSADSGFNGSSTVNWGAQAIAGTSDPTLYRTERYGANLQYTFAVPNGIYQVALYFAENYVDSGFPNGGIGFRVFSVLANGVTIVSNLDLFAQVGAHQAVIKTATVTVTNGQLVLSSPAGWFVNAIQITSQSTVSDTTPPSVPAGVTATPQSSSTVQLSWNASTDSGAGVGGYRVLRNGSTVTTVSGTSFLDTGRSPSTTYTYTITAFDLANPVNESAPSTAVPATTLAAPDTTPPTVPTGLAATPASSSTIQLSWNASTDTGTGVGGYRVLRNGSLVTSVSGTSYLDTGRSANTTYSYTITAFDLANPANVSAPSTAVQATTPAIVDTSPPTVPSGLVATPLSTAQIQLNWSASTDAGTGIGGYHVLRAGTQVGTTGAGVTTFTDSGLTANTTYSYTVTAIDLANPANESTASSPVLAATLATNPVTIRRIDAGGGAYSDSGSNAWSADTGFNGGGTVDWGSIPIAGTNDPTLYRTERYGANLQYSFTVPNGTYQLRLYFCENYVNSGFPNGGIGFRVFSVLANGVTVVSNLDLFATVGPHVAVIKTATVTVTNGQLVLSSPNGWFVNAIEVVSQATAVDVTPPSVPTGLGALSVSNSSIRLSWNPSSDSGTGVGGYHIYRNGVAVGSSVAAEYIDTGFTPGTPTSYTVSAFDQATPVNESAQSTAVTFFARNLGKIMPLGDSLTEGCCGTFVDAAYAPFGHQGYRGPLATLLFQAGYAFTYVGSQVSTGTDGYQHEGHPGIRIGEIDQSVVGWLAASSPDTVLLMTGSNDVDDSVPPHPEDRLDALIHTIATARPGVQIFVALLPPRIDVPAKGQIVLDYNQKIPGIVASALASGINAHLVDIFSVVNATSAELPDGIHPTNDAYQRIAQAWFNSIQKVLAAPDATPPSAPTSLSATPLGSTSIRLSWNASTDSGTGMGGYVIRRGGVIVGTSATTTYTDTGLAASTLYSYTVTAFDNASPTNLSAPSAAVQATTPAAPDITPPTVPTGSSASALSDSSIQLGWTASTDVQSGVAGYRIFRNGVSIGTTSTASWVDVGLAAGTLYSYAITAFDAAAPPNESAQSAAVSASTLGGPLDITPPTLPNGLIAHAVSSAQINLSWNASSDLGTGIGGYKIRRNGVLIATAAAAVTVYADTGLTPATTYSYTISAIDLAVPANESATTAAVIATTPGTGAKIVFRFPQNDPQWTQANLSPAGSYITPVFGATDAATTPTPGLGGQIAASQAAGQVIVGYVDGLSSVQPRSVIKAKIDLWYSTFPNIDGIYLGNAGWRTTIADGMSYTAYWADIAAYIHAKGGIAVIHPGGELGTEADFQTMLESFETLVLYESYVSYVGGVPLLPELYSWMRNYQRNRFAVLANGIAPGDLFLFENYLLSKNVGYIYLTNVDFGATDDPDYWASEIATLAIPLSVPPDTTPPSVPAGVTATPQNSSAIRLSWNASTDAATGVGGYRVLRNGSTVTTVSGTSYFDTGRSPSTTYSYTVTAFDLANPVNESAPSAAVTATTPANADTTPPTVPAGLTATPVNSSSISLQWNAASDVGTGVGGYHVFRGGVQIATTAAGATSFADTGLSAGTQYAYRISAFDSETPANESALSAAVLATTLLVVNNTVLRIDAAGGAYTDSAGNVWSADTGFNSSSTVNWGAQAIGGTNDPTLYRTERYGANLQYNFLLPNGTYQVKLYFAENYVTSGFPNGGIGFRVFSVQANGVTIVSNLDLFAQVGAHQAVIKTATVAVTNGQLVLSSPGGWFVNAIEITSQSAAADTTPPNVPTGLGALAISTSSIQLSWNAATDLGTGVGGYRVFRNGTPVATVSNNVYAETGLAASTLYTYTVSAFDQATPANESAQSSAVTATTLTAPDITPPTVPAGLTAAALSSSSIQLSWNPSTDTQSGVAGYRVFRNGVPIGTTNSTSWPDVGLSAGTPYTYRITAFDAASTGNESAQTSAVTATTLATPDITPPTVPAGLTAAALSSSSIQLSWNASTDAQSGVAGYRVFRNGAPIGTTNTTSWPDGGLAAGTQYTYAITAFDAASAANESAPSAPVSTTTVVFVKDLGKIMPLGDSITVGCCGAFFDPAFASLRYQGYRGPLATLLSLAGYTFSYVGSQTSQGADGYQHEGHGGWFISDIDQNIDAWLTTYTPDTVLLLIGTVDVVVGSPAQPEDRLNALIRRIGATRPEAQILVGTIPPEINDPAETARVLAYNQKIPGIVVNAQTAGINAHLVDIFSVVDASGADLADGVHPTNEAYQHIAQAWFSAIESVEAPPDITPPSVPAGLTAVAQGATSVQLTWNASTDAGTGVGGYRIQRDGTQIGTTNAVTTGYIDTGLEAHTTYTYTVIAIDLATPAANASAESGAATVTTDAVTAPPAPPGG